jgi:hypothetical protein
MAELQVEVHVWHFNTYNVLDQTLYMFILIQPAIKIKSVHVSPHDMS